MIRAIIHPSPYYEQAQPRQQIGRMAYKCCCALSQYDVVYAHMRKSNTASRKAAEHAGFVDATAPEDSQRALVWRRPSAGAADEQSASDESENAGSENGFPSQLLDGNDPVVELFTDLAGDTIETP